MKVTFCRRLNTADPVLRRLSWQLLDAGTSVGANLEEADAGQPKGDFIAKAAIARKESAETTVLAAAHRVRGSQNRRTYSAVN